MHHSSFIIHHSSFSNLLLELLLRTSTQLPNDVVAALNLCHNREAPGSHAAAILTSILQNAALAASAQTPICQDTGALSFFFKIPAKPISNQHLAISNLQASACAAVRLATQRGLLRKNTIDTLTGASIDDNVAHDTPACYFEPSPDDALEIWLLQKGGGSENASCQFALPDESLRANRDLPGVRACVLDALWRIQGQGCSPGTLGVCIGGDRASGYLCAKKQLLRALSDSSPEPQLASLETQLLADANSLGIGPMGLGGNTTLLGVKAAALPRLPASYFVSIAYMCWASRRRGLRLAPDGAITWLEP